MDIMKFFGRGILGLGLLFGGILLVGCQSDSNGYHSTGATSPATPTAAGADGQHAATDVSAGSAGSAAKMDVLRVGDAVSVMFSDLASPVSPITADIKEDGSITLTYNEKFQAEGKSLGELQQAIRERYVPKYFKYMTPVVRISDRFYSVGGEVRQPNRQLFTGSMTVLRAINSVGGFTEFARKTKVQVIRANGEKFTVNCIKALQHPELDKPIYPGDQINVPKRLW